MAGASHSTEVNMAEKKTTVTIKLLDGTICGIPVKPRARGDVFEEDPRLAANLIYRKRAKLAEDKEEKPAKKETAAK